jgi:hypothetical protein
LDEGARLGFDCGHYGDKDDISSAIRYGVDTDDIFFITKADMASESNGEVRDAYYVRDSLLLAGRAFKLALNMEVA